MSKSNVSACVSLEESHDRVSDSQKREQKEGVFHFRVRCAPGAADWKVERSPSNAYNNLICVYRRNIFQKNKFIISVVYILIFDILNI